MDSNREDRRITLWTQADDIIETSYGRMTYREWCERERNRFEAQGEIVEVVTREDGTVALFRD